MSETTERESRGPLAPFIRILVIGIVAVVVGRFVLSLRPKTDIESVERDGKALIESVGGPTKICEEASVLISQFEPAQWESLSPLDLEGFPAIASLAGTVYTVQTHEPRKLIVRMGNKLDGYFIEIIDTDDVGKFVITKHFDSPEYAKIEDTCTIVIRR